MSTLGTGAMALLNASISFVGALGGHLINGSDLTKASTLMDIGFSTILGFIAGYLGRAGALNPRGLNNADKTAGFIRACGLYDNVLTKVTTGGYRTAGIAANALRLSGYNLTREWNKMIVRQAGRSLAKALAISGGVLLPGAAGKVWLVDWLDTYI